METLNLIRFIVGVFFIILGLVIFCFEIFCVHKLKYILNRMHFAGAGDTSALLCTIIGAIIINGFDFTACKLILVFVFFWFASPVSSHLISRLVSVTDDEMDKHVKVCTEEESEKIIHDKE